MNILVSNDDGIDSPGIIALAQALSEVGKVTVVAPHRERSTAGHSLTLHKPLRFSEVRPGYYAITGTPADCVYVATRLIMKQKPDVIVSGINRGANLGSDVYYSGTVAAAREGAYFGAKSFAFSLCYDNIVESAKPTLPAQTQHHFETAAQFAKIFVPMAVRKNYPNSNVLNVNVPNLPFNQIKGVKVSKQGRRHYEDLITERRDPRNKAYYWLGGEYKGFDDIAGSDCVHVDEGYISVTPLKIDSTDYQLLEDIQSWELGFNP